MFENAVGPAVVVQHVCLPRKGNGIGQLVTYLGLEYAFVFMGRTRDSIVVSNDGSSTERRVLHVWPHLGLSTGQQTSCKSYRRIVVVARFGDVSAGTDYRSPDG